MLGEAVNHDVNGAEFTDWRMPAKRELNLIHANRMNINALNTTWYWSASETSTTLAWRQRFQDGNQHNYLKTTTANVRAVRNF